MNGLRFIHPLWRSLLNKWLSNSNYKVFICTPILDSAALLDICKIALANKLGHIEAIYTQKFVFFKKAQI